MNSALSLDVVRAAALLLLGLTAGVRAEDEKEKLGTVIGIDLGTTCAVYLLLC